jgi:hypothetical protein
MHAGTWCFTEIYVARVRAAVADGVEGARFAVPDCAETLMRKWSAFVAVPALALAGLLGSAAAHARSDVQWSISIGVPFFAPPPVYYAPPPVYYAPPHPVIVRPAPIYYVPRHGHPRYYRDVDRDGIPNRYDRHYDPYGDRDRDGAPNRWDRNDRNPYQR